MNDRHRLIQTAGLTEPKLAYIGAIAVLASHVEHYAERAIWALTPPAEAGTRPWTDGKPISELIVRLEKLAKRVRKPGLAELIHAWCRAAVPCFSCRHSVMHGNMAWMSGEWAVFTRNSVPPAGKRKRNPSDFHASEHTLNLLETAFEHLLNGIHLIQVAAMARFAIGDIKQPLAHLREAWSIGAELDNLAAAVQHEKY